MTSTPLPEFEFEARQLTLPNHVYAQSPQISSFLYDPISSSLALRYSDSSFALYPRFSPFSQVSFSAPKSIVPSSTSAASFFHLRTGSCPVETLFIVSSPVLRPSPGLFLSFYLLRQERFVKLKVISKHKDLEFDSGKCGILFRVNNGVSFKLSAGVNMLALYSAGNAKIWVFAMRLTKDEANREALKLMKFAVINCSVPVFTAGIFSGLLVLGEENGVRVFSLQILVNDNHKKAKKRHGKNSDPVSVKPKSMKLKQDSGNAGVIFVPFEDKDVIAGKSAKALSLHPLSSEYTVVLDSLGNVHLLHHMHPKKRFERLNLTMKTQKMAVFQDVSSVNHKIWISDGSHTVHLLKISGLNASSDETEKKESAPVEIRTSVTQAIFISEKIQEILPLDADSLLVLGQGSLFAYRAP